LTDPVDLAFVDGLASALVSGAASTASATRAAAEIDID
jgi:hypothetical protein